jgi:hypothetical protein
MAKLLDGDLDRLDFYFEPTEGADVIGPLVGVLDVTRKTTAADVRAKIVAQGLGAHASLPRPVAELPFCFLAYDKGAFSVVSRAQEREMFVLGPKFAVKPKNEGGNWRLVLRGSSVLSRAGALDPEQAEILRRELDGLRGGGGETKGADVVGEIADILTDLHEQRDEQGEQRERRVPGGVSVHVAAG